MLVSIVIPAYNAARTLEACLRACLDQTYPETEVIVADDGSTDGTPEIAARLGVRYLWQENRGPAAARNTGARAARGEIIAFTDSDCVPASDWIEQLMAGFAPDIVAVGGTYGIANPESRLARLVHEEIVVRHTRFKDEVDFLGSFNVAYRKDAFDAVNGFDESFTAASGEDNDLAYRLQDAGGTLRFHRAAVVAHHHPVRLLPYLRTQMWHGFWRVKIYARHRGRARTGDRYASGVELLTPPAMLVLLGLTPLGAAAALHVCGVCIAAGWLALFAMLGCAHVPMALQMMRSARRREMLLFPGLALLRDAARAFGLGYGFYRFYLWHGDGPECPGS